MVMAKASEKQLTQAVLQDLLDYNPATGALTWKPRPLEMFSHCKNPVQQFNAWNAKYAGKPALTAGHGYGYLHGGIYGKSYLAHRVIVCLMSGEWPPAETDHKNGVKYDNRWENIEPTTQSENMRNAKMRTDNTSGITGICWDEENKKYLAQITNKTGKRIKKHFASKAEAIAQRQAWEIEFGYSERHGT